MTTSDPSPITHWLSQFSIYSTVLLRAKPDHTVGLFHYMEHIRILKSQGYERAKCDTSYRKLHATNRSHYPFDRDLVQLQIECSLIHFPCQLSIRLSQSFRPKPSSSSGKAPSSQYKSNMYKSQKATHPFPYGTCLAYQGSNACTIGCLRPDTHHFCYCSGNHPGIKCASHLYDSPTNAPATGLAPKSRKLNTKCKPATITKAQ